ncbi:MAG: cysteine--tRNA ligase, partial [Phycisphaerae bacterium]|nr:cysteine--tRNA ligase [Phycisphaerae bacterium]
TRRTEPFKPGAARVAGAPATEASAPAARVLFYSCGPTVYDDAHIGNFRSFLNADVLRRTLELLGHPVRHVMNITDVGHMTDDEDADGGGEDKMAVAGRRIAEAKKAGKLPADAKIDPSDPYAIAEFYAQRFLEDARHLGLKVALEEAALRAQGGDVGTLMPRPSRCIPQMLKMIGTLIERGNAYVASDGVVYFDVRSFPAYGQLSGNTLDQLKEGAGERISAEHQAVKRHPADFMLWKADARHLMRWPSPWGEGYPGWHIECSAMADMLLGAEIDLHSGGEDNIFPHHECEVAQSCCASGRPVFARFWFHTRFLQVEGQKMSKSKGNFFTARDLFAKGVTPAALRLELVRTHYRTNSNFTMQGLQDCQRMIDRWSRAHAQLVERAKGTFGGATEPPNRRPSSAQAIAPMTDESRAPGPFELGLAAFTEGLCDDLNVARAIAALNEAVGASASDHAASDPARELASMLAMDSVLGVLGRNAAVEGAAPAEDPAFVAQVEALLAKRAAARSAKNWADSDAARDALAALGVAVKDGPQGQTWSRT